MQVVIALMLDVAAECYFGVMVKNFSGKEVDLTQEHHADNDGSLVELLPIFPGSPHSKVPFADLRLIRLLALPWATLPDHIRL